jgi:hypothetical protein
MNDITSKDINHLWWTAYNANDARTAVLCQMAMGCEIPGWEQEPDADARREVERIIRQQHEAEKEAAQPDGPQAEAGQ